ncbi:MAG TPA: aldose epimerase [Candidatus Thermoplasmatota archaeon]|nr:aldose epimerase [Candidatus Thermoplasmatota archaeon]
MPPAAPAAHRGEGQPADELQLQAGGTTVTVSPYGASLRRAWTEQAGVRRELVWGYHGRDAKRGGQGDVLMPFAGRIAGGTYTFGARELRLPANDKAGPNAIHGLVRNRTWEVEAASSSAVAFVLRLRPQEEAGYPFDVLLRVVYEARQDGLACRFEAQNLGQEPCPFGAGFHPYLVPASTVDAARLHVPASAWVERDGVLPTGALRPVPEALELRGDRAIGGLRLDDCFTGLARDHDGLARVRLDALELWMDASFPFVQVFTGDTLGPHARQAVAVEPMTCGPGAFRHPGLGRKVLQPGETARGTWGVRPVSLGP